jgi:solute carrier family 35 protein E1
MDLASGIKLAPLSECIYAAASGLFMVVLWITKLQPVPQVDRRFLLALLPVALFHVVGHVSACLSFSQMAVSFAHIVKSAEPVRLRVGLCTYSHTV